MDHSYNSDGIDPDKPAFTLIPEGPHVFQIKKATPKQSAKGYFMVECECEIINNMDLMGKTVKHYVTFLPKTKPDGSVNNAAGIAVHFLKVIGQPWEGQFDITASDWEGGQFLGQVKHEPYVSTKGKNAGKEFMSAKIAGVDYLPEPAGSGKKSESDIPF